MALNSSAGRRVVSCQPQECLCDDPAGSKPPRVQSSGEIVIGGLLRQLAQRCARPRAAGETE